MPRQTIIHQTDYNGIPIQQGKDGIIQEIIKGFAERLEHMTETCSQVLAVHLITTFPDHVDYSNANEIVGSSVTEYRRELKRKGILSQAGICREVAKDRSDEKPHFHTGIILDSHNIQSGFTVAGRLNEIINNKLGIPASSIYTKCLPPDINKDCQREISRGTTGAIKLRKNKPGAEEQKKNIINRFSYMAKATTKGNAPKYTKEYTFSRMPRKNNDSE